MPWIATQLAPPSSNVRSTHITSSEVTTSLAGQVIGSRCFSQKELLEVCLQFLAFYLSIDNHGHRVVTRKFGKSNTHKDIPKTLISVEFLIVAINTPANAANMNMNQALDQGKDTFNLMQTAPSLLGRIQEANDISTVVLDNAKFVAGTWDTFIEKLKMFTDIMDKISGVNN